MRTDLIDCWNNKLFSLVAFKEKVIEVEKIGDLIENKKETDTKTRQKLLIKNRNNLVDLYLMLQCILANNDDLIQTRKKILNNRQYS